MCGSCTHPTYSLDDCGVSSAVSALSTVRSLCGLQQDRFQADNLFCLQLFRFWKYFDTVPHAASWLGCAGFYFGKLPERHMQQVTDMSAFASMLLSPAQRSSRSIPWLSSNKHQMPVLRAGEGCYIIGSLAADDTKRVSRQRACPVRREL